MVYLGKTISNLLHLEADEDIKKTALRLRKNLTEAEKILWIELKNRKLEGLKFRRQHPLHYYVADFYCHEQRLVIEVDGQIHKQRQQHEHDENRSAELERYGIRIIRFTNEQVENSIKDVLNFIVEFIKENPYE